MAVLSAQMPVEFVSPLQRVALSQTFSCWERCSGDPRQPGFCDPICQFVTRRWDDLPVAGHSGLLSLWRCHGVNNITCAEWAQVDKIGTQEAGGRQERRGVGSGAEPSTLMLHLWHLGRRWLQGPSGDNSQDQRTGGIGGGGGDGFGGGEKGARFCLSSLLFSSLR